MENKDVKEDEKAYSDWITCAECDLKFVVTRLSQIFCPECNSKRVSKALIGVII